MPVTFVMLTALIILILTIIGVSFTRLPHINVDRPAAALVGGLLMVLAGVLSFNQAFTNIDFHTITLLLGMMLLMAALQQADFFNILAARSISLATSPWQMLMVVVIVTAVGSAFMVNDVVVLLFTPVLITACRWLNRNPIPYLVTEAMASNIGSVATEIGNPQKYAHWGNLGYTVYAFPALPATGGTCINVYPLCCCVFLLSQSYEDRFHL